MGKEPMERVSPVSSDPRYNRKVRREQIPDSPFRKGSCGEGGKETLEGSDEAGQWGTAERRNKLFPGIIAIDPHGTRSYVQALSL